MAATVRANRPVLSRLRIPQRKATGFNEPSPASGPVGGYLTPDLQPNTPPTFPNAPQQPTISKIGEYLLLERVEAGVNLVVYKAIHIVTEQHYTCKVIPCDQYQAILLAYYRSGCHDNINDIVEVIKGATSVYVFFPPSYGDLHSYVRSRRKLKEAEAVHLFEQIVSAVQHCHDNGIVLRDIKLRKFVFKNPERTELKLEGLEDAHLLEDDDDSLSDKHGCPAYVSPEILNPPVQSYSGRAADIWGLGVMLYTILIGRYPFHDVEPSALFTKIRQGQYAIPDSVSSRGKCLIHALLRHNPSERLLASEISHHPWFTAAHRAHNSGGVKSRCQRNASQSSNVPTMSISVSTSSHTTDTASMGQSTRTAPGHASTSTASSAASSAASRSQSSSASGASSNAGHLEQNVPALPVPPPEQYPLCF